MESSAHFGTINYIVLFAYMASVFGIGLSMAGKQKTTDDYFLAGRNMPWFVVSMSIFASIASAISYMGLPAIAYKENISMVVAGFVSIITAPFIILLFFPFYRKLNVTTSYSYIYKRYGPGARYTVSGLFIAARLGWLGVVIYAPALALSVVTGVNIWLAIILMGSISVSYTLLGGLKAVIWTDLLQFTFLIGGAVWVAVTLVNKVPDGFAGIMAIASANDRLQIFEWEINIFKMSGPIVAVAFFFQMMQDYGTDQISVQRLMAIKNFKGMAKAIILNAFFDLLIISLLLFVGLGMFAYYQTYPDQLTAGIAGDNVLPFYIIQALPVGISGLVITAIFAAAMSSMDSGINSLSTVVISDFIRPLVGSKRSEEKDLKLARILTLVFGLLGILVACYASTIGQVLKAAQLFISLFSGPVLGLFLLGVLTRKASFKGWIVGTVVAILATLWLQFWVEAHFVYYFPFCFSISFIVGYLASLVSPQVQLDDQLTIWGHYGRKNI